MEPEEYYPVFWERAKLEAQKKYGSMGVADIVNAKLSGVYPPASFCSEAREHFEQQVPLAVRDENWNDFMDQFDGAWYEAIKNLVWSK